jgi:UDP-2-acetamido-3-amino-2,3-dideoxy-glucuronate N-acetyltransferase
MARKEGFLRSSAFVHPSAIVDEGVDLGEGCRIWHFCHVQSGARLGRGTQLGHAVFVAGGVSLGKGVKVQNHVSIYAPASVEDDVFVGPGCVIANLENPRAEISRRHLYRPSTICRGATLGANTTILPGVTIGRYAFVAAGAVVTRSVADFGFVAGVPARPSGFMSRHGHRLFGEPGEIVTCPEGGLRYKVVSPEQLVCLDLSPDEPLPASHRASRGYREIARGKP